jgi:hypothetical protein
MSGLKINSGALLAEAIELLERVAEWYEPGGTMPPRKKIETFLKKANSGISGNKTNANTELGAELKWNAEADDWNQWDSLGRDEKDELIEKFKASNAANERSERSGDTLRDFVGNSEGGHDGR